MRRHWHKRRVGMAPGRRVRRKWHPGMNFPVTAAIAEALEVVKACQRFAADARTPLVLENVFGLQRWLGPATHHFGKFYLWGDGVPALLPKGPRWKDRQKMVHRSPWLRGRIPGELAAAIAEFHTVRLGHRVAAPTFSPAVAAATAGVTW